MRPVGTVLLVLLLVTPIAGAASWLQLGYDAARTGATPDEGPARPDVALRVQLPGVRTNVTPLVIDGAVFLTTRAAGEGGLGPANPNPPPPGLDTSAIWRIDLATAEVVEHVSFEDGDSLDGLASDGERLFVAVGREMRAYAVDDGEQLWATPFPEPALNTDPRRLQRCDPGAVDGELVVVACWRYSAQSNAAVVVAAFESARGSLMWWWTDPNTSDPAPALDPAATGSSALSYVYDVAISGDLVLVVTEEPDTRLRPTCTGSTVPGTERNLFSYDGWVRVVWALERTSGAARWAHVALDRDLPPALEDPASYVGALIPLLLEHPPAIAAVEDGILVQGDRLLVLDRASGCPLQRTPVLQDGEATLPQSRALAARADRIVAIGFSHLLGLDAITHEIDWTVRTDPVDQLVVAGSRTYVATSSGTLIALSLAAGTSIWETSHAVPLGLFGTPLSIAVSDGLAVASTIGGEVVVYGRSPASIQPRVVASTLYPEPGGEVHVDVGGSTPGLLADDLEFQVDWGDGTASPWQEETRFRHVYEDPGEHEATVVARNAAGQSSSEVLVFSVGQEPPPSGLAGAVRTTFAGEGAPIAWLLVALLAMAAVVAVSAARRAQRSSPRPTGDATEVYRDALQYVLADDGTIAERDTAMLVTLRKRLGLTERDHAILEYGVLTEREGVRGGLVLEPGRTVLGKYDVVRRLGAGGQGETFVARDNVLERDVVLKVLRGGTSDPDALLKEARAMSQVRHDNVVTVHDVDRVGEDVFVVMELLEGGSLDTVLGHGRLDGKRFRRLAGDVLAALGAVHATRVVHRDVKPANILFTADGRAKLADFGIAHVRGVEETVAAFQTEAGAVGTLQYMSPEQAKGQRVSRRSDLYSAGLVLYEAWTGEPYHALGEGDGLLEVQMRAAQPGTFSRGIDGPDALKRWFERALAPDPAGRFSSAEEMVDAIDAALRS